MLLVLLQLQVGAGQVWLGRQAGAIRREHREAVSSAHNLTTVPEHLPKCRTISISGQISCLSLRPADPALGCRLIPYEQGRVQLDNDSIASQPVSRSAEAPASPLQKAACHRTETPHLADPSPSTHCNTCPACACSCS